MTLTLTPVEATTAPLARRNPVAKLGAALLLTLPPLAALDPVTPLLSLAVTLAALPFFGLRYGTLARRSLPLLTSVGGVVLSLILFAGSRPGRLLLDLGPFDITTGVLWSATALGLRVLAVALPGVVALATTDPTDLADALVQNLRAPARFAIGTLAALRLAGLLTLEWQTLGYARRARGLDGGRNPLAHARLFTSTAFALLVGAIRRGTRLAVAMDARGFDSGLPRTHARHQPFRPADTGMLLGAAALAALIVTASAWLGAFRPLF